MKFFTKPSLIVLCGLLAFSCAQAQSLEQIREQMIKDWERAKEYTEEYLNTMPADKYSYKTTDSVRSFAQQMLHLASANVFLMSNVSGEKPPAGFAFTLERRPGAQQKDSVVYYVTAAYDYAIRAVKSLPVDNWFEKIKVFNRFEETKFAMMHKAFEHQSHHRGQTTMYIRNLGIRPPQEKLF